MSANLGACLWRLTSIAVAAVACASAGAPGVQSPNQLTAAERAAGWRLLFDGTSLAGWRSLGYDSVPTAHWRVSDGAIMKVPTAKVQRQADGQPAAGGDLMSIDSFRDFELAFEWRVTPGANSGVKYNVSEELSLAHVQPRRARLRVSGARRRAAPGQHDRLSPRGRPLRHRCA